ncbi:hypothetical protein imdm_70 [gamma proteobacterium IMCC2047]|nr:hypothetical protein imdm_70 [gamma proteobacterium IMCC2047]
MALTLINREHSTMITTYSKKRLKTERLLIRIKYIQSVSA